MRHTTTSAVALLLALAATGCGDSGEADSKPSAGTPSPSASIDRDGQYIAAAQDIPFTGRQPSDEELLAYPAEWCAGLDQGHSVEWLFSSDGGLYPIGQDWGTVKTDAYQLLLAGVKVYCPQHVDAVTAELRASGEY